MSVREVTNEKLDEINQALRRRYSHIPEGLLTREATSAYLAASSPYAYRDLAGNRDDRARHRSWLERCPSQQVADSIDIDAYLALELLGGAALMRSERAELELLALSMHRLLRSVVPAPDRAA